VALGVVLLDFESYAHVAREPVELGDYEPDARPQACTEPFIEKVEQRYSIGMVAVTRGVCDPAAGWRFAAAGTATAMTFTIVAPPCAVVLATMPPLWSAIANVGRHGVLAKSAVVMQQLSTITQIAFSKTGTLRDRCGVILAYGRCHR
jgi:cation transport ATPase